MSATNTGSDSRRYNFFIGDNEIVDDYDLGPFAGWLYIVILRHLNQLQQVSFPSLATLAKEAGMSEPTVIKYIAVLQEKKLIEVEKQFDTEKKEYGNNHYRILPVLKKAVKEVNQGGKTDLPGVVKEVESNNTSKNNTVSLASAKKPRGKRPSKQSFTAEKMNPVKDRIVALFGWDWETMSPEESGQVQKAAYSWLCANGTFAELDNTYAYCQANFEQYGPNALNSNRSKALQWKRTTAKTSETQPQPGEDIHSRADDYMRFDENGHYIGGGS